MPLNPKILFLLFTSPLLLLFFNDLHFHLYPFIGVIPFIPRLIDDLVRDFYPGNNLAKDSIIFVQKRRVRHTDEELRPGAVGVRRPRHRERASLMRLAAELGLHRISRTAHAMGRLVGVLRVPLVDQGLVPL